MECKLAHRCYLHGLGRHHWQLFGGCQTFSSHLAPPHVQIPGRSKFTLSNVLVLEPADWCRHRAKLASLYPPPPPETQLFRRLRSAGEENKNRDRCPRSPLILADQGPDSLRLVPGRGYLTVDLGGTRTSKVWTEKISPSTDLKDKNCASIYNT
ncbi:hypothetical protein ElyMa_005535000 [Elysia marginata]|uniref:Uncharacterized protein n=1 Tax=Elysia marginata TaxID=1093978 RepID=A0AAV4EXT5_9GAST|nr:hypothetical protein ElyMa_005535000 [Elysia marginata]